MQIDSTKWQVLQHRYFQIYDATFLLRQVLCQLTVILLLIYGVTYAYIYKQSYVDGEYSDEKFQQVAYELLGIKTYRVERNEEADDPQTPIQVADHQTMVQPVQKTILTLKDDTPVHVREISESFHYLRLHKDLLPPNDYIKALKTMIEKCHSYVEMGKPSTYSEKVIQDLQRELFWAHKFKKLGS